MKGASGDALRAGAKAVAQVRNPSTAPVVIDTAKGKPQHRIALGPSELQADIAPAKAEAMMTAPWAMFSLFRTPKISVKPIATRE